MDSYETWPAMCFFLRLQPDNPHVADESTVPKATPELGVIPEKKKQVELRT